MTAITGDQIPQYRYIVLLKGLALESKTGMKVSRGASCYQIIKREFGLKGSKAKVYEQFKVILQEKNLI
jgi:hypothetical protein